MAKFGDVVKYLGESGPQKADVVDVNDDGTVDLAVWDGESYQPKKNVPEKKPGGEGGYGHTWQEIG